MNTRPVAATFFVLFCLLLCGLILRRQITAHPLPPDRGFQGNSGQGNSGLDPWTGRNWQPAGPVLTKQVQGVVRAEITALRGGDMARAVSYLSHFHSPQFTDPNQFLQIILERHPELIHGRVVRYAPIRTDPGEQTAWSVVLMEGPHRERILEGFVLTQEGGQFKISYVRTLPN